MRLMGCDRKMKESVGRKKPADFFGISEGDEPFGVRI